MYYRRQDSEAMLGFGLTILQVLTIALWIPSVVIFSREGSVHESISSVTGDACGSMNGLLFAYMIILSCMFFLNCCACIHAWYTDSLVDADHSATKFAVFCPVVAVCIFNIIATVRLAQAGYDCRLVNGPMYKMVLAINVLLSFYMYLAFFCGCEFWLDYRLLPDEPSNAPPPPPAVAAPIAVIAQPVPAPVQVPAIVIGGGAASPAVSSPSIQLQPLIVPAEAGAATAGGVDASAPPPAAVVASTPAGGPSPV